MHRDTIIIGCIIFCISIPVAVQMHLNMPMQTVYDCRIAEISPDIPPHIKQLCRERSIKK